MEHLMIDASPAQLRKLRKGDKVRVKKGKGFNLIVRPETYKRVSRSFNKDKGTELALSKEELDANNAVSPEQHAQYQRINPEGRGIFGKKFDKFMSKQLGKDTYGAIYKAADELKPMVKAGVKTGLTAAGAAATPVVAAYAPMLAPFIPAAVSGASMLADSYIDNPDAYQKPFRKGPKGRPPKEMIEEEVIVKPKPVMQTKPVRRKPPRIIYDDEEEEEEYQPRYMSGLKGRRPKDIYEQAENVRDDERMNHMFGTNYNYMGRAGMQQALADTMRKKLNDAQIASRFSLRPRNMSSGPKRGSMDEVTYAPEPRPFEGPSSYERSMMGQGISRESGVVGLKGGMIHGYTPQAMESQPYGANFQMQHFLPPQFHKFNAGTTHEGMIGTGVKSHPDHVMAHLPPALQSQPMGANFMMKNFLPTQYQLQYQANPILMGQGLYAGKGVCGTGMYL
jgi:hypothetical protein